jgi:hypothetical protein
LLAEAANYDSGFGFDILAALRFFHHIVSNTYRYFNKFKKKKKIIVIALIPKDSNMHCMVQPGNAGAGGGWLGSRGGA